MKTLNKLVDNRDTDEESQVSDSPPAIKVVLLRSWKEVANQLQVSVRTVQTWEKRLGLPIQRLGSGKRARILADPQELENWLKRKKAKSLQVNSSLSQKSTSLPVAVHQPTCMFAAKPITMEASRIPRDFLEGVSAGKGNSMLGFYRVAMVTLLVIMIIGSILWMKKTFSATPVRAVIEYQTLKVYDQHNRLLWKKEFSDINPKEALGQSFQLIGVVDGADTQVVLVEYIPKKSSNAQPKLFCFSENGDRHRQFDLHLPKPTSAQNLVLVNSTPPLQAP